jgi:hypothetical protein
MVNAARENRTKVSKLVIANPQLFPELLKLTFETDNKLSIKAAWVLEFVCKEKLPWLIPHLDFFCDNISKVQFDSVVRPVAKICELLAKAYSSRKNLRYRSDIHERHIEKIIEAGFDWLIGPEKVAVKAYTMEILFLFGKNHDWVHEELKLIIEKNISQESAAYKARGKKILTWINKN